MSTNTNQGVPYPTDDAPVARRYQFQGESDVPYPEANTPPRSPSPKKAPPAPKKVTADQADAIVKAAVDQALKASE